MPEQKQDRLHIKLHVYDEEIEVVINRDDEEFYRAAAKLITERYNAYAQAYKGRKSDHTVALMTLIDIALMYQKERSHNDTSPYDNVLAKLTREIEEALGDVRRWKAGARGGVSGGRQLNRNRRIRGAGRGFH